MATRSRVLLCSLITLSQAGCALSSSGHPTVSIIVPDMTASRTFLIPSGPNVSGMTNQVGTLPAPLVLGDFTCLGVMVTGDGIQPNQALLQACGGPGSPGTAGVSGPSGTMNQPPSGYTPGPGMPSAPGVMGGLVPITGGSIDIAVPGGPSRLIQLFGIQSAMSPACQSVADIIAHKSGQNNLPSAAGTAGTSYHDLGDPIELARTTTDIFSDVSVSIKAAFNPAKAAPLFTCNNGGGNSMPSAGPTLVATNLSLDLEANMNQGMGAAPLTSGFGGSWVDLSPSNNVGGLYATTGWAGVPNRVQMSAVADRITLPNNISLAAPNASTSMSVDLWAQYPGTGSMHYLYSKALSVSYGMELYVNPSGALCMNTHASALTCTMVAPANFLVPGSWNHLAGVWDSVTATLSIYVNDQLAGSVACVTGVGPETSSAIIGNDQTSIYGWMGAISAVHLYNGHALNSAEVRQNCKASEAMYGPMGTCL